MRNVVRTPVLSALCFVALAACEDGQGFPGFTSAESEAETETAAVVPSGPTTVLKDVERPDIFNVTEAALWDGRPSLGGVWVAHPDITTPERVILTNTSNGKSIPGALFRRERNNPGPSIQVSSDAAGALGMLAGQPTELTVLVVRQEEVVIEPDPLPISEEETLSAEELAVAGVVDESGAGDPLDVTEEPKRRNFFQRLFGAPEAPAAAAGVVTIEGDPIELTDGSTSPIVETTTLDPVSTSAAAAIARAEATDKPVARPSREVVEAEIAAAPEAPTASGLRNPFIQIGLFSVEANADAAAANLRQSGIVPSIQTNDVEGGLTWRVRVGPVSTAEDQAALLAKVRSLGYSDAFLTPE